MGLLKVLRSLYYCRVLIRLKYCGRNVILSRGGCIKRPCELEIGNNVFISRNFYISAREMKIGDNVMIGPNFLAECDDHVFDSVGVSMYELRNVRTVAPIRIEDDVWIGGNVTILKGVVIGEGCVIGAGSVVTRSMPPYTICFGVPCKPFKQRFLKVQLLEHLKQIKSKLTAESVLLGWDDAGLTT